MRRRDFVIGSTVLAGGAAGLFAEQRPLRASVQYPGRDQGHWLRDAQSLPEPTDTVETEVLIAGGGVAGLTAAWQLAKGGVTDQMRVSGPELYGNAASGSDGDLVFPTGAHYLPLPSLESTHIREMLADFGIIQGDPFEARPRFDERFVVHAPADRVLYRGAWQEGYLPTEGIADEERVEHERFFSLVEAWTRARGSDGRRAFAVPLEASSVDGQFRDLDRQSFRSWLRSAGYTSPTLHWYLNYCCRDDYGRGYQEISAWAGFHYFCSRDGQAANADKGAVLTWPQGLGVLASRLEEAAGPDRSWRSASVASLRATATGVEAVVVESSGGRLRSTRVMARQAIAAMPMFVLRHVLANGERYGYVAERDTPEYAPWLVSNFILRSFPEERGGSPLSWDNVVYEEPGLGYVVSTHQDIRMSRPNRSAFTAYYALSEWSPDAGRRWLERATPAQLTELAGRDLRLAYGWRLPFNVERVAITVRGHAMAIPHPGFLSNAGAKALRETTGPIVFAHSDLSGLSLFEEAAWWGHRAAAQVLRARGKA